MTAGAVEELAVVHLVVRVLTRRLLVEVVVRLGLLAGQRQHIIVVHETADVAHVLREVARRPSSVAVVVERHAWASQGRDVFYLRACGSKGKTARIRSHERGHVPAHVEQSRGVLRLLVEEK